MAVGAAYVLWMGVAVVARQWHYPTDALAGMAYGVGVVLVADGVAWRAGTALAGRVSRRSRAASGRG
jgi:membrane-associated phospholipid phosphatase